MAVYGIVAAMLISLLHGGEYSEGTLRNKLICGCDRVQVYLSQAVVSVIICSMMYLLALATALVLGVPLFDLHVSISHEMLTAWIGLMCSVYYASLYTMVTAICRSRTAAVATNMALSVGMLLLSVSISEMLIDPASGNEFWRIVLEMIPTGQAVLVNEAAIDTPVRLALLDICGAAACACVGAYAMHSMDIC